MDMITCTTKASISKKTCTCSMEWCGVTSALYTPPSPSISATSEAKRNIVRSKTSQHHRSALLILGNSGSLNGQAGSSILLHENKIICHDAYLSGFWAFQPKKP